MNAELIDDRTDETCTTRFKMRFPYVVPDWAKGHTMPADAVDATYTLSAKIGEYERETGLYQVQLSYGVKETEWYWFNCHFKDGIVTRRDGCKHLEMRVGEQVIDNTKKFLTALTA